MRRVRASSVRKLGNPVADSRGVYAVCVRLKWAFCTRCLRVYSSTPKLVLATPASGRVRLRVRTPCGPPPTRELVKNNEPLPRSPFFLSFSLARLASAMFHQILHTRSIQKVDLCPDSLVNIAVRTTRHIYSLRVYDSNVFVINNLM